MRVSPARAEDLNDFLVIINAEVNTRLNYDPPVVKILVDLCCTTEWCKKWAKITK